MFALQTMPPRYSLALPVSHTCWVHRREAESTPRVASSAPEGVVVDRDRRKASVDGRVVRLTFLEFELRAHLVAHPRRVSSRVQLISEVWGKPAVGDFRTVDVHIARLRRKLGPVYRAAIATVRQVGYTYDPALVPS